MKYKPFSKKQLLVLSWWCDSSKYRECDALICDGAVRSGKTFCMSLSYVLWAMSKFENSSFAICGKTIRSLRRNVITPLIPVLKDLGFDVTDKLSDNTVVVSMKNRFNRFYLFSGKDESSASLIQGMTLSGVMLDEVALMPRSFVEQALARCSVLGSTFWFNCNPENPGHWFYTQWIKKHSEKNALYIHFEMSDNPSLSKKLIQRYESLYTGAFYQRFVKGRWVAVSGAVYPFMDKDSAFSQQPTGEFDEYAVSCDYGTVNPCSMGLWARQNDRWYRIDEYYFDSKKEGFQRTDEEHYQAMCELIDGRRVSAVAVDPSAASFIEVIRRHGRYSVVRADNNVLYGIRRVISALKEKKISICDNCIASKREFSLYRWDESKNHDVPVKDNDHAMDDIRYFVTTITDDGDAFAAVAAVRQAEMPREVIN